MCVGFFLLVGVKKLVVSAWTVLPLCIRNDSPYCSPMAGLTSVASSVSLVMVVVIGLGQLRCDRTRLSMLLRWMMCLCIFEWLSRNGRMALLYVTRPTLATPVPWNLGRVFVGVVLVPNTECGV